MDYSVYYPVVTKCAIFSNPHSRFLPSAALQVPAHAVTPMDRAAAQATTMAASSGAATAAAAASVALHPGKPPEPARTHPQGHPTLIPPPASLIPSPRPPLPPSTAGRAAAAAKASGVAGAGAGAGAGAAGEAARAGAMLVGPHFASPAVLQQQPSASQGSAAPTALTAASLSLPPPPPPHSSLLAPDKSTTKMLPTPLVLPSGSASRSDVKQVGGLAEGAGPRGVAVVGAGETAVGATSAQPQVTFKEPADAAVAGAGGLDAVGGSSAATSALPPANQMPGPTALPFEFRALEVCLEAACGFLEGEVREGWNQVVTIDQNS